VAHRSRPAGPSLTRRNRSRLPFDKLSEEKGNAYFAEGFKDEILTRLRRSRIFKVISRTSTQRFKSAPSDLREIAKQLGVNITSGRHVKSLTTGTRSMFTHHALTDHISGPILNRIDDISRSKRDRETNSET